MRILLVRPPVKNSIDVPVPRYVKEEQGIYPPLGIMYIASSIENQGGHEVSIIDAEAENLNYKKLEKEISRYSGGA